MDRNKLNKSSDKVANKSNKYLIKQWRDQKLK